MHSLYTPCPAYLGVDSEGNEEYGFIPYTVGKIKKWLVVLDHCPVIDFVDLSDEIRMAQDFVLGIKLPDNLSADTMRTVLEIANGIKQIQQIAALTEALCLVRN